MPIHLRVDGREVDVADDGASLLEVLRDRIGVRSPKDGCSPQGQCGCCTVLVDGQPRVACVTPARRVAGRAVTTLDGFPPDVRRAWAEAFTAAGASQCGFCTPGIIVRLAALAERRGPLSVTDIEGALVAHLCRCTGWRTIVDAARAASTPPGGATSGGATPGGATPGGATPGGATPGGATPGGTTPAERWPPRDLDLARQRAEVEGGVPQRVGPEIALGEGGFSEDTAPADALVAVPDGAGGWAVGETLAEARAAAGKIQGRRTPLDPRPALELPPGDWAVSLRTSWVEPAYLEPDASWCRPGGEPASPLANGGAFGAKLSSVAPAAARMLADRHGRPVRVVLAREDVVRLGPKRPPVAAGLRTDGSGTMRVVRTPGISKAIAAVAPGLVVEEVEVVGPPTSAGLRAAGWAEAAVLLAALRWRAEQCDPVVVAPNGAVAAARVAPDGEIRVVVACGPPLDEVVLRSYAVGAAHQGLGWVTSEGLALDEDGVPQDLTIRSFGVLRARDMPPVDVVIVPPGAAVPDGRPAPETAVNGSDAVFAAVAAAAWIARGLPTCWPTDRRRLP